MIPIPAIDFMNGQIVRLRQGMHEKFTVYNYSPHAIIEEWYREGVRRIHLIDLDGAKTGIISTAHRKIFSRLAKSFPDIELQVGGGIRGKLQAQIYFESGIQKIVLGSLLVKDSDLSKEIIESYSNQVYLGIDCRGDTLTTQGWLQDTKITTSDVLDEFDAMPIAGVIYTDVTRDGMLSGVNSVDFQEIASLTKHPCIIAGGLKSIDDVRSLKETNIPNLFGVIMGKSLLEKKIEIKEFFDLVGRAH